MSFKKDLINMLEEFADLMEFKGENKFKISAFRNGANSIRRFEGDFEAAVEDGTIRDVKGIGKGLQAFIYELKETGNVTDYDSLKNEVPQGIIDIMGIRGIGAKKVKQLFEELGIDDLIKLEEACRNDKIASTKGFGGKTQEKILEELERIKRESGFIHLSKATRLSEEIEEKLKNSGQVKKLAVTGELRRSMEIISKIEFVVLTDHAEGVAGIFEDSELKSGVIQVESYQVPVLIHLTKNESEFYKKLFTTTGSDEFLSNSGITIPEVVSSEENIFLSADKSFVIPELREVSYFDYKPENSDLAFEDFKGLLHFHTVWSDGMNSLQEMRRRAEALGFEYAAVCDHSRSAFYANGLTEERVLEQTEEIAKVNAEKGITVFQGIESDILRNGDLDYPEDFLKNFNFVVASIHSNFNLSEDEMTSRIIKAIENPYTDLLAHPTGRLLLSRQGYKVDIKKIIDACAENDVAIEINANAYRLDLDWRNLFYAREKGVKISINPDAHSIEGITDTRYGIGIARKGGVKKSEVINCFDKSTFINFINRKVTKYKN